jgi:hypothetical protein
MKPILIVLLVIASQYTALAQKKNTLFVDLSCNNLGGSATFDRKLTRHFDVGIGLNIYDYKEESFANLHPALYADFRPNWLIRKKSLLFLFVDIGAAYNGGRKPINAHVDPIGLFTSLGLGYNYLINKRGMGPYISTGLYGYSQSYHSHNLALPPAARDHSVFEASLLLSIGFKF